MCFSRLFEETSMVYLRKEVFALFFPSAHAVFPPLFSKVLWWFPHHHGVSKGIFMAFTFLAGLVRSSAIGKKRSRLLHLSCHGSPPKIH